MRTIPSRRGSKNVPSRPVGEKDRPFPSWKNLYTVPFRREKFCAPSRAVEQYIYTVPSRRESFFLRSRPVVIVFIYLPVPSRQL